MARRGFFARGFALVLLTLGVLVTVPLPLASGAATPTHFADTGKEQLFTVPTGVTMVYIQAVGAPGGSVQAYSSVFGFGETIPGGLGAQVSGYLSVIAGERLFVEVGGAGSTTSGGFNGGGSPGTGTAPGGGGGGGASDVRTCSSTGQCSAGSLASRLLVAAGGGGAGGCEPLGLEPYECAGGGNAGSSGGTALEGIAGLGGGAGTASAGGAGGAAGQNFAPAVSGADGSSGVGGAGGDGATPLPYLVIDGGGGGGGGGGSYGGGGGGEGALECYTCSLDPGGGGGGGSSATDPGIKHALVTPATSGTPSITVTPTTPSSTSVTCTSPVLAGVSSMCTAVVGGHTTTPTGTVTWSVVSGSGNFSQMGCVLAAGKCQVSFQPTSTASSVQTVEASYGGDPANFPSSGTFDIVYKADANLAISQTAASTGSGAQFVETVSNAGPDPAVQLTLHDSLSTPGVKSIDVQPASGACGKIPTPLSSSITFRCSLSSLQPGATWTISIALNGGTPGTSLSNQVSVVAATPVDPFVANNTSTLTALYGPIAHLVTTALAAPGPHSAQVGAVVTVTNQGPLPAASVRVSIGVGGPGVTASVPPVSLTSGSCARSPKVPGETYRLTCSIPSLGVGTTWQGSLGPAAKAGTLVSLTVHTTAATVDPKPMAAVTASAQAPPLAATTVPFSTEPYLFLGNANNATASISKVLQTYPDQNPGHGMLEVAPVEVPPTQPPSSDAWVVTLEATRTFTVAAYNVTHYSGINPAVVGGDIFNFSYTSSVVGTNCPITTAPSAACALPATSLVSGFANPDVAAGHPDAMTVRALDYFGRLVPSYTGKVVFAVTDPDGNVPPSYTFTTAEAGSHTFPLLNFALPGITIVTTQDAIESYVLQTRSAVRVT